MVGYFRSSTTAKDKLVQVQHHLGMNKLREKLHNLQLMSILSLATLLDPRIKVIGFFNHTKASEAIKRLTSECSTIICSTQSGEEIRISFIGSKLWHCLDTTVEVQRYLSEPNISRLENPLEYWGKHRFMYPNLYGFTLPFLCAPVSFVPCERVFSTAEEVV